MINMSLSGCKIAVLASNGFTEQDITESQKTLRTAGADVRIISADHGLINGWNGENWGHSFAVDSPLSAALGADYAALIIPGGERSLNKLKQTAHTRRFVGSFLDAGKPVVALNDGIELLLFSERLCNRTVVGDSVLKDQITNAGGHWGESDVSIDDNLMTAVCDEEGRTDFFKTVVDFFVSYFSSSESKAA